MAFSYKDYTESDSVKNARKQMEDNSTYTESQSVTDARNALQSHEANKVADWTGGQYGTALTEALNKINNREKFTYDLNGDALYNQYKDQYINAGKLAMQDTIGQASAMTGGYGNSYAATAGNQAYQTYLQSLNDKIPELYQLALDQYNQEGEDLYNQYSLLSDRYNTEYGEYRDQVSDWNTQRDYLSDAYNNERSLDYSKFTDNRDYYTDAYNNAASYDYSLYSDAYDRAFNNYQQSVSEAQYAQSLAEEQRQYNLDYALNQQKFQYQKEQDALAAEQAANTTTSPTYDYKTYSSIRESLANYSGNDQNLWDYLMNMSDSGYITLDNAYSLYDEFKNGGTTSNTITYRKYGAGAGNH